MAITSASELEAVLSQVLIKIDKHMYERGKFPPLEAARREIEQIMETAREPAELKKLRQRLAEASEVIRGRMGQDKDLSNDLWDAMDFIDYRC